MNYLADVEIGIKSYLEKANQPYKFDKEKGKFMFSMNIASKIKKLDYYIFVTDEGYYIVTDFDLSITKEITEALAKYLHQINYYSYYSSFVLNLNKNQVYCQNFTNCIGIIPSQEIIAESILSIKELIIRFGDVIVDITEGLIPSEEHFEKLLNEELEKEY